jgi:hypothetical protein
MLEQYEHHGKQMWVRSDLKGQHRDHCLCYQCTKFNFEDREANCPIANALFHFDVLADVTTPVWECAEFVESK